MDGELETLPIFPLSNVVLFPLVRVPLHIFEPRYRQMAHDCLAGSRRIGMVTVRPEHADDMAGDPPVFDIGCAGAVVASRKLPDGRYNLVLRGTHRFAIEREPARAPERLYRVGEVRLLEDGNAPADAERIARARARVVELVGEMIRSANPDATPAEEPGSGFLGELEDAAFVNSLCNAFAFATPEKQGLIEAETIYERFDRLAGLLSFRLAERRAPGTSNSGALH